MSDSLASSAIRLLRVGVSSDWRARQPGRHFVSRVASLFCVLRRDAKGQSANSKPAVETVIAVTRSNAPHYLRASFCAHVFNEKGSRRRRKHCALAVVRRSQKFLPAADPLPAGAQDGQNLISWRWSLPLSTNPVWWGSMHAIELLW